MEKAPAKLGFTEFAETWNGRLAMIGFVGVLNNPLHVSTRGYAYLNYIGPALIIVWLIGFFYLSGQKKSTT